MKNPFQRKPSVYGPIREQLMDEANGRAAYSDEFTAVLKNLDHVDRMEKRSSEMSKALIAAGGTVAGVAAIYVAQQFGGYIIPKALESLASRHIQKTMFD